MTKINKQISLMLVTVFSSCAVATNNYFTGPYLTLGAGITQSSFKESNSSLNGTVGDQIEFTNKNIHSATAIEIAAGIGYSKILQDNIYLAIEGELDAMNLKKTYSKTSFALAGGAVATDLKINTTIKSSFKVMALGKSGLLITPKTALYGIIGTEITRLKVSEEISYLQNVLKGATYGKKTSNKVGLALGLGIKSYVRERISIGLDFIYTVILSKLAAPKLSTNMYNVGTGALGGSFVTNSKYRMCNNTVCFKMGYHF